MATIGISGLAHHYGAIAVLEGVDLEMADGEAHAILGGSGAGKTTLLNLLSGLLQPSEGAIRFDGRDVTSVRPAQRNVAQVFQFPVLYPALTVAANLGFPLMNQGWNRRSAQRRVNEVAELLALGPLLHRKPRSLSLFEKQMTAIGRALVRPDVALVLLDEPLTAVEPAVKWRLRRALKAVRAELGLTMIYVTHDQTEALTFADRITMLHQGSILQTGSPAELYQRPAHETVARFIGSPGMNLIQARVVDGEIRVGDHVLGAAAVAAGDCALGFRPEWASIGGAGMPVTVRSHRALGAIGGVHTLLATVELNGQIIHVRQPADEGFSGQPRLRIDPDRLALYRNGWRLTDGC